MLFTAAHVLERRIFSEHARILVIIGKLEIFFFISILSNDFEDSLRFYIFSAQWRYILHAVERTIGTLTNKNFGHEWWVWDFFFFFSFWYIVLTIVDLVLTESFFFFSWRVIFDFYCHFQPILIDGRGHLLGRLAAITAKTILQGRKVIVVRCEQLNISGNFFRFAEVSSWVYY